MTLDFSKHRTDFHILKEMIHGKPLVYLDNAATTQKAQAVLDVVMHYYEHDNANVHRSVHLLSERATAAFEAARKKVCTWIHAAHPSEIIFTRGTTEGINLVAQSYGRTFLKAGDEVVITAMEHHSNIVPWQLLCQRTGVVLKVAPIEKQGELIFSEYEKLLNARTRIVAFTQISNALGTENPIEKMIAAVRAQAKQAVILIDGAQAIAHRSTDVQKLDCDFYVFSGHKMYGPTGIGILYGKQTLLEKMPPWQGGGEMIREVTFAETTFADLPHKFEAGTPNIADAIGLGAAVDYLQRFNMQDIADYEHQLWEKLNGALNQLKGVRVIGNNPRRASIVSFTVDGIHPHDIGTFLDQEGVAIRTGHHCAMPVMNFFNVPATARASLAFYNTSAEIDIFIAAIQKMQAFFQAS